ncbi:MAG: ATPase [Bdellovibrionales bacterium RIFOXYD1_FULL_53_11]|nr:MAG: ATPase [Bdellovibrionales bacterium RIFOXYD1_FULL_53_11]
MYPRFYKSLDKGSFFLLGPRSTGKTTWLKNTLNDAFVLDLLHSDTARRLLASPSRLRGMIPPEYKQIVIDEVQKIPELLDEVHRLMEKDKLDFILTGSSARKLKRGGANLLAGRAIVRSFHPLTCWELGADFKLDHALKWGMLPRVWTHDNPSDFLATYVHTFLKEEVFAEGLTRNLHAFSRFLEICSFSQAQPLSMANIAKDVDIDPKVVAGYFELLEDMLLGIRLPVFSRKAKRRMSKHHKFFLFDAGVYKSIRPKGPLDHIGDIDGPGLETLFLQHYRALSEQKRWDQQLYFWRTASSHEVDFVSYGSEGLFAFEIQRSPVVSSSNLDSLRLFLADYPVAKAFMLYGGTEHFRQDNIECIGFEEGLKKLPELFGTSLKTRRAPARSSRP